MTEKKEEIEKKREEKSDLFIPAGLFIGLGVGFFLDQLVGGMFIGLGAGFLMAAVAKIFKW